MSISKIKLEYTGGNKQSASVVPDHEKNQYITAEDLNKIKSVVNTLSDDIVFIDNNTPTKISELTNDINFITSGDVEKETIYVTEFPTVGVEQAIYVDANGETKMWVNNAWKRMSYEVINSVVSGIPFTVPTTQAVYDFVSQITPGLPDNITTQGNTFNSGNNLVKLVNGKIPSGLYDAVGGDVQHIYYIDSFPSANFVSNTLYIHKTTKEIKFSDGSNLITVVLPVSTNLTNASDTSIPTTLAVKTAIDNIEIPSAYVLPIAATGKLGGISPDNITCKTDANGVLSVISSDVESVVSTNFPLSGDGTAVNPITLNFNTDDFAIVNNQLTTVEKIVIEDEFPATAKANSLYVNSDNQAKVYDGTQWRDISLGVVESISGNINHDVVATSKAVNDFVVAKISDIPSAEIPEISIDIATDILSNDKTVSPKAVSKYIAENVNTLPAITENNSFLMSKLGSGTDADDNTNDLNTVFLMQNGVLENVAAGKPAGSSCDFSGITSDGDYFVFNGSNWIVFNNGKFGPFADSLESYTIDMKFIQTSRSYIQYPFGPQDNSWPQGFITADGTGIQPHQNDNLIQNFTADTEVTFSMAYDATTKTCWTWLNGGTPVSGDWSSHTTTTATQFFIGRNTNLASDTGLIGKMKYFRISKVCRYSGKTFTPPVAAYGDIYTTWEERSAVDAKTILGITDGLTMYNASVADDGKVTLLNTNVTAAEMNIGDEINVLSGNTTLSIPSGSVYIRTIKQIGASASEGTSILVKGISTPAAANGVYNQLPAVDGEVAPTWKHESADYWIMLWTPSYWCITANEAIENPGSSLFHATRDDNNPWDITSWTDIGGSYINGEFAVEKYNPVVNDNISLFYGLSNNSSGGITSGLQLETVDVFPISGVNNTLYIDSTSSAKIYANDKWNEISSTQESNSNITFRIPEIVNDIYSLELDLSDLGDFSNKITVNSTAEKEYFNISTGTIIESAPSGIADPYSGELLFFDLKSYIDTNDNVKSYKYFRFRWKNSTGDYSSYGFGKIDSALQVFNPPQENAEEIAYAIQKTEVTTNSVVFKNDKLIYKIEVSSATGFTFDISQLNTEECYTFELWVHMSTPVTLTFPAESVWIDGTVPDMSESGLYCIVIRKLPATMVTHTIQSPKLMMNLAYKYAITLA